MVFLKKVFKSAICWLNNSHNNSNNNILLICMAWSSHWDDNIAESFSQLQCLRTMREWWSYFPGSKKMGWDCGWNWKGIVSGGQWLGPAEACVHCFLQQEIRNYWYKSNIIAFMLQSLFYGLSWLEHCLSQCLSQVEALFWVSKEKQHSLIPW